MLITLARAFLALWTCFTLDISPFLAVSQATLHRSLRLSKASSRLCSPSSSRPYRLTESKGSDIPLADITSLLKPYCCA
jgi:hypothetical protein